MFLPSDGRPGTTYSSPPPLHTFGFFKTSAYANLNFGIPHTLLGLSWIGKKFRPCFRFRLDTLTGYCPFSIVSVLPIFWCIYAKCPLLLLHNSNLLCERTSLKSEKSFTRENFLSISASAITFIGSCSRNSSSAIANLSIFIQHFLSFKRLAREMLS